MPALEPRSVGRHRDECVDAGGGTRSRRRPPRPPRRTAERRAPSTLVRALAQRRRRRPPRARRRTRAAARALRQRDRPRGRRAAAPAERRPEPRRARRGRLAGSRPRPYRRRRIAPGGGDRAPRPTLRARVSRDPPYRAGARPRTAPGGPVSVTIAAISSAGVTSNAGLRAGKRAVTSAGRAPRSGSAPVGVAWSTVELGATT